MTTKFCIQQLKFLFDYSAFYILSVLLEPHMRMAWGTYGARVWYATSTLLHQDFFSAQEAPSTSSHTVTDSQEATSTEDCYDEEISVKLWRTTKTIRSTMICIPLLTVVQAVQHLCRVEAAFQHHQLLKGQMLVPK